jgi:chromosome segregation ATPase
MVQPNQNLSTSMRPLAGAFAGAAEGYEYNPEEIARRVEERRAQIAHNLGMSEDGAQRVGLIDQTGGAARRDAEDQRRDQEKRRKEQIDRILLMQINQRIAEIDARLGELYDIRDQITAEIEGLERGIGVLDGALGRLRAGEELERNEDGSLADEELEAQIRAYERRMGREIDRDDPDALIAAIMAQREYMDRQLDDARRRHRENTDEIDGLERERRGLEAERDNARRNMYEDWSAPAAEVTSDESRDRRAENLMSGWSADDDLTSEASAAEDDFDDYFAGMDDSFADEVDAAQGFAPPVTPDDEGSPIPSQDETPSTDDRPPSREIETAEPPRPPGG